MLAAVSPLLNSLRYCQAEKAHYWWAPDSAPTYAAVAGIFAAVLIPSLIVVMGRPLSSDSVNPSPEFVSFFGEDDEGGIANSVAKRRLSVGILKPKDPSSVRGYSPFFLRLSYFRCWVPEIPQK
jgi:hypothetical protein